VSTRVEAYYNLHKKCLSYRQRGERVQHAHTLLLNDVKFAVQPAGREKTRQTGQKRVHAFARGEVAFVRHLSTDDCGDLSPENMDRQKYPRITYNPHKHDSFVFKHSGEPVHEATQVALIGNQMWLTGHVKEEA